MVEAEKFDVVVNRFMNPPGIPLPHESPFPINTYIVDARPEHSDCPRDATYIPLEVLSGVKVLASIPEYASLDSTPIPFALRLRTEDLDGSECKRLQIIDFTVELEQLEHYRLVVIGICPPKFSDLCIAEAPLLPIMHATTPFRPNLSNLH
jgi:hypothetical protein